MKRRLISLPGWHTERKIVVLDSDDWGSIALPSLEVLEKIEGSGFRLDNNPYLKYDALASENDLMRLFETLKKYKDKNGRNPVITANTVVANPDFTKIRASGFKEYHYEIFTDSLKKYPAHEGAFKLWEQGIHEGVFYPQFHAREHLNVAYWMRALQIRHPQIMLGFDHKFYILDNATHQEIKHSCTSAHYPKDSEEYKEIATAVIDGLNIFRRIFGYNSGSFTATGYIWNSLLEPMLAENGVKFLKGIIIQRDPQIGKGKFKSRFHYTGQKNRQGQFYLVRNAFFEPALMRNKENCVVECLDRIKTAFSARKPAIITTHRINYVGYINEKFRDNNLKLFGYLLKQIIEKYPEVEFLNSDELGNEISG